MINFVEVMKLSKRVKVGLYPRHMQALNGLKKQLGIRSDSETLRVALYVCWCLARTQRTMEQTDSEYLQQLFDNLSRWEEPANGDTSRLTKTR